MESFVGFIPPICFFRLILFDFEAARDDLAGAGEGFYRAGGHGLDEDVADGGGFGGAGDDGAVAGIGGGLVEEFVAAAAAYDVDGGDFLFEDIFETFEGSAISEGEAVEAAADEFAVRTRWRLIRLFAEVGDFLRHLAGGAEGFVIGVDQGGAGFGAGGHLGEGDVVVFFSVERELASAFLDEPEAHDVFEEADGATDAAFVGVVIAERFGVDDGVGEFDAHEGPGAGADVAPTLALRGDGGDGAAGVVTGGGDDGGGLHAAFGGDVAFELSDDGSAGDDGWEDFGGEAEFFKHAGGPVAALGVVHLAGGGDGEFAFAFAAEEIVEEVGHEEEGFGAFESGGAGFVEGDELEEGVEGHELDAGGVEDLLAAELGEGAIEDGVGARVAIHIGIAEDLAVASDEAEIDAPGIDADAGEGCG